MCKKKVDLHKYYAHIVNHLLALTVVILFSFKTESHRYTYHTQQRLWFLKTRTDRASRDCTSGGSCLSSPTRTNRRAWNSGLRLARRDTCDASSTMQMSNERRENRAALLTPRHVVATTGYMHTHQCFLVSCFNFSFSVSLVN